MSLPFKGSPGLTLGIELEVQLIDWKTRDVCPAAPRILRSNRDPFVKSEIFQSMVEINTPVCRSVAEARRHINGVLTRLRAACEPLGVDLASAGTHPFALYSERSVFPAPRYRYLLKYRQWFARRLMIFGLHVHLGMRDGDHAIRTMNALVSYLPKLLALSSSSPFWQADDTGLASVRTAIFEAVPNAGTPVLFDDWSQFERYVELMLRSRSIAALKDVWWDIRPNPYLGTLEIRIADALPTLDELFAWVAILQCLAAWVDETCPDATSSHHPLWIYRENKWRATRWGLEADMLVNGDGETSSVRDLIGDLVGTLEPYGERLGCARDLAFVTSMLEISSASRQRRIYETTRSFPAVVDTLITEFRTNERVIEA